jgi:hypothetical protein
MARRASCSASAESRQRADSNGPEPAIAWLGLAYSTLAPAPRSHVTARIRLCSFCIVRDSSRAPLPLAPHAAGGRVKPDWRLPVYAQSEQAGGFSARPSGVGEGRSGSGESQRLRRVGTRPFVFDCLLQSGGLTLRCCGLVSLAWLDMTGCCRQALRRNTNATTFDNGKVKSRNEGRREP